MSNTYLKELYALMLSRYDTSADKLSYSQWIEKNTSLRGRPFSFNRYPYQRAVIDDPHPTQVGKKPSQVGWSEISQRWSAAFLKRNLSTKGIYAYPDDDMRKKNVQTRFMPILDNNEIFNGPVVSGKPIRSIELLQIEQSYLYVTGSKVGDATSTDADFVLLDEYDLHDMKIAALFMSRLQNSDWKIEKYFSTPTFSDFGVDKLYEDSDQMLYMIKCDACNHWQFPLFTPPFIEIPNLSSDLNDLTEIDQIMIETHHLELENSYVCCEKCRAPLDLGREDNRAWVAKYPSRTHLRGRRINPFSVSTRPVQAIVLELLKYKRNDFIRGFRNSVLGEAEDSSSARISEADILTCLTGGREIPPIRRDIPTWVGIDMGHNCHITVGQGYSLADIKVVRFMVVKAEELLETVRMINSVYTLVGGLVDRHPETQQANAVRDITYRKILPCEYRGTKEINLIKGDEGPDDVIYIQADRTTLLDEVKKTVSNHTIVFSGYEHLESDIKVHLRNMVRVEAPETPAVWKKLDPNDHFFHSLGLMLSAVKMKHVVQLKTEAPQSVVAIAAADMSGYNTDIYGNHPRKSKIWLPPSYLV